MSGTDASGFNYTLTPSVNIDAIAVPRTEWERLNQRVGFLEGVWNIVREFDAVSDIAGQAEKRYAEICNGGGNHE